MKRINIQFHATTDDFVNLINEMLTNTYKVWGGISFPEFEVIKITNKVTRDELGKFDMLIVSKCELQETDDRKQFLKMQDNNLGITVGKESEDKLFESCMWIWSESDIDKEFKQIINAFKKKMNKGAWVFNTRNNAREYYDKHLYTDRAKLAYENGIEIHPIAGWNLYELKSKNSDIY